MDLTRVYVTIAKAQASTAPGDHDLKASDIILARDTLS